MKHFADVICTRPITAAANVKCGLRSRAAARPRRRTNASKTAMTTTTTTTTCVSDGGPDSTAPFRGLAPQIGRKIILVKFQIY